MRNFLLAVLLAALAALPVHAQTPAVVIEPGAAGAYSYEKLAKDWWMWLRGNDSRPALDRSGESCKVGQRGDVWFLAGTVNPERVQRKCSIPYGRAIFFPLVTLSYFPDILDGISCEGARSKVMTLNAKAAGMFATIDGLPAQGYRATTEACFDMMGRKPASRKPRRAYPSAADGYWLLLRPLPRGRHIVKFGGTYEWPLEVYGDATQNIEYELTVY